MSKRSSEGSSSEGSTNKKVKADNPLEGLDSKKFMALAPNLNLTIAEPGDDDDVGDDIETFVVEPKVYTTGSYGWSINGKIEVTIMVDGKPRVLPVNMTANLTVSKSKPPKSKEE